MGQRGRKRFRVQERKAGRPFLDDSVPFNDGSSEDQDSRHDRCQFNDPAQLEILYEEENELKPVKNQLSEGKFGIKAGYNRDYPW